MKIYHIGLDFGTYQSKACIYDIDTSEHEFFKFPSNHSFFLSSRVAEKSDGRFEYGEAQSTAIKNEYYYFKIASAEDDEFIKDCTPEFLSVIYLTFLLFTIKQIYYQRNEKREVGGGLLSSLLSRQKKDNVIKFTIQMGIPTEWSQEKNLKRKRKFENILMLAEMLQLKYKTLNSFLEISKSQLINDIKDLHNSNSYTFSSKQIFEEKLNDLGLSVYPETAAGLYFILETKQLLPGYYAIMDIGGGSTDLSFFRIEANKKIAYLASESYIMAANNVYAEFAKNEHSVDVLRRAEEDIQKTITNGSWTGNQSIRIALRKVNESLDKIVYKLFHKRVYHFSQGMVKKYKDQPIILYGGGALLPVINEGSVMIHDNGNKTSLTMPITYMNKDKINKYTSIINILPSDDSWKKDFVMLVVALGLSYRKSNTTAIWLKEYHSTDGDTRKNLIPHPVNEGMFIYDVLNSKWN
jgi:hypothetical protein